MDETTLIPPTEIRPRDRAIVAAIAVVVMVLALLRPTPDLRDQGDGVNSAPLGAASVSDLAEGGAKR